MGVGFSDSQSTLVGALWYRGSTMNGCTTDADGDGTPERYQGNWGSYVMAPLAVVNNADKHNRVMRETSANELNLLVNNFWLNSHIEACATSGY